MDRRNFIRASGLIGLALAAGCSDDSDTEALGGEPSTPTDREQQAQTTPTETTETPTEGDGETPTETEEETPTPQGEAQVSIVTHELVVDEGEFSTDVYVAAEVENAGDAPTGTIELTAQWYDADGNYLDNDQAYLYSLGAGETWAARVYYLGSSEDVGDYEFDGTVETEPGPMNPEGLELMESEMNVGEDEAVISGTVGNNRDEAVSYIEAVAKVYNSDGSVLGDEFTNTTEVPPGETWAFEIAWWDVDRVDQAAEHEVWLSDTAV
ncbi:FxLYD domain-containing protein [Halobacteriales archaeon Cl-PHB]